jgi:hypothetical protein
VTAASTVTIKNVSDGNLTLDTFTATTTASGTDNTPNPTPNWADVSFSYVTFTSVAAVQQIQGISGSIDLQIEKIPQLNDCPVYYRRSITAPDFTNGGAWEPDFNEWTEITSSPITVNVSNNDYLMFACDTVSYQEVVVQMVIRNLSDNYSLLDSFNALILLFEE